MNMLISIVFSFRNEEENIPELVRRVTEAVATIADVRHEMIFVNDDSSDESLGVLKALQERHPITIINMSRRFGVTPCIMAGLAHAKGDAVICMDTDLQDPPELIPQMVQKFRDGADVLFWKTLHHPSWQAEINGRPAIRAPAFGVYTTLLVPAGRSEVAFAFAPKFLPVLLIGTIVWIGIMGILPVLVSRSSNQVLESIV